MKSERRELEVALTLQPQICEWHTLHQIGIVTLLVSVTVNDRSRRYLTNL